MEDKKMNTLNKIMQENYENKNKIIKEVFSKKLKELREERNLSQNTIAQKLGCAVSTYANWEQGRREPSIYDIFNILYIYNIEANELFEI